MRGGCRCVERECLQERKGNEVPGAQLLFCVAVTAGE